MAIEIKKITLGGELIYPATISDAVMHPELKRPVTDILDELMTNKVILSEEEYEGLDEIKEGVLYLTYEDEDD